MKSHCLNEFKSSASNGLTTRPKGDGHWSPLHKSHVARLSKIYGAILEQYGLRSLVIHSGVAIAKHSRDDQFWPVVATPSFLHWVPLEETPCVLVISQHDRPQLYVKKHDSFWDSAKPMHSFWSPESFTIHDVKDFSSVSVGNDVAFIGDDCSVADLLGIPPEQCNRSDLISELEYTRTLKSDYEVACILRANELAAIGHSKVRAIFESSDASELDLFHSYLSATRQTESSMPYGAIIAMGSNCGVLHHVNYCHDTKIGQTSFLVDAGCKFNGYASDVTRTWVRGVGSYADVFAELISGVDNAQRQLVSQLTIGRQYEDLHNAAHFLLADVLVNLKIIRVKRDEAVASGLTRIFFPHGLGHSLGLQVHDVGMKLKSPATENRYLRNTAEIAQGQVVTIEPGIYFIPSLLEKATREGLVRHLDVDRINGLLPFGGVRIEDNVLATTGGPVNLSVDSPRCGG